MERVGRNKIALVLSFPGGGGGNKIVPVLSFPEGVETKLPRFTIPTHTDPRHTAHTAVRETNPLQ
jgi:hypothetical protein